MALSRLALSFLDRFLPEERRRLLEIRDEMDPKRLAAWRALVQRSRGR